MKEKYQTINLKIKHHNHKRVIIYLQINNGNSDISLLDLLNGARYILHLHAEWTKTCSRS
jgi:hypothetical protein